MRTGEKSPRFHGFARDTYIFLSITDGQVVTFVGDSYPKTVGKAKHSGESRDQVLGSALFWVAGLPGAWKDPEVRPGIMPFLTFSAWVLTIEATRRFVCVLRFRRCDAHWHAFLAGIIYLCGSLGKPDPSGACDRGLPRTRVRRLARQVLSSYNLLF